ncbi:branched-chain amino acid ABC transporter substrate-binding protein [Sporosarcina sp. P21c]|uniref:ABC transporter substrate-binding protein n=1 Tax=Sporosarcina TaxID=1569 RepID=UPI000A15060C|nr:MULTISPECIES: ABC transporter substrate-binding protein [Sporosarcina]ARJ38453.1 branched-chain amino acid ABC transporter substrate-binding protein [Sporosarcina ureae]PIC65839.1 branched-chain amino acid ABC transporter substrate-binding protein [Sporosarcina sp. P16a]PIC81794.1 branched-chain amino acid ABC transporter substrate-binding protein [Sporosarcina sp. P1]PIC87550.1 branched-chain amino acid ABC transporter substrate-binding protein [Sporosarcina sp. P21c]PIC91444.1 branched-ch
MSKRSKLLFTVLMAFTLVMLAACGNSSTDDTEGADSGDVVKAKVGVISYLTGPGASYGEAITNGINLAHKEITELGEVDIELKIEDSAGKQEEALSVAQKLMNSENVDAIIGPTLSTEMQIVGPEADLNGVPILGTSNTAEGIPQLGEYVFRNSIPETLAIPASVQKAIDKYGAKKVAILYGNDDVFTKAGYDTMKQVAEDLDLEVLTTETFQLGQSDYKAQLTKIKSLNPDLVLASALYNEGAVILDQARKMGIDVPFVGGNGFNSPEVIEIAGDAANGLIVATPWFAKKDNEKVKKFVEDYKAAYGMEPDQFAAQAYDGFYVMAEAIKNAGEADRDAIRDALAEIKDFEGVLGNMSFDEDGDIIMEPTVLIIEDDEYVVFE